MRGMDHVFEYQAVDLSPYFAMEQAGATPVEVFRQAISDGVPRIHVICMMRDVCNLGLRETMEVVRIAESPTRDPGREAGG